MIAELSRGLPHKSMEDTVRSATSSCLGKLWGQHGANELGNPPSISLCTGQHCIHTPVMPYRDLVHYLLMEKLSLARLAIALLGTPVTGKLSRESHYGQTNHILSLHVMRD
jgi:hypothetical protein